MSADLIRVALDAAAQAMRDRDLGNEIMTHDEYWRTDARTAIVAFLRVLEHDMRIRNLRRLADAVEKAAR